MQNLRPLDANQTPLASKLREQNVRTVRFHHLADLVQAVQEDVVNLVRVDNDILDVDLHAHDQFTQLLLSPGDLFLTFAGDVDLIFAPTVCSWRGIAENTREGWRKVYSSVCSRFDELYILTSPTADQCMHCQLQLHGVHMTFELLDRLANKEFPRMNGMLTYDLVDHDEQSGLRMLCTLHVSIDGHPEAVIQTAVCRVAIRGDDGTISIEDLGTQEENISTGVCREGVQVFQDTRPDTLCGLIHDEVHINIHSSTPL